MQLGDRVSDLVVRGRVRDTDGRWRAKGFPRDEGDLVAGEQVDAHRLGGGHHLAGGRGAAKVGGDVRQQVERALRRGADDVRDLPEQAEAEVAFCAQLGHMLRHQRVGREAQRSDARVLRDRAGAR